MKIAFVTIILFYISNINGQENCNVLFEDFSEYTPTWGSNAGGIVNQSEGEWLFYDSSAGDGDVANWGGDTTIGNYINIPSTVYQGSDYLEPSIMRVLDLENISQLTFKFKFYNECGHISVDFLQSFTSIDDNETLGRVVLDYSNNVIIQGDTVNCVELFNEFNELEIILDFEQDSLTFVCHGLDNITRPFSIESNNNLYSIAFGSIQCNFIDDLCVDVDENCDGEILFTSVDDELINIEIRRIDIDHFTIINDTNKKLKLHVYDIQGRLVMIHNFSDLQYTLDLTDSSHGLYIINVTSTLTKAQKVMKVVK